MTRRRRQSPALRVGYAGNPRPVRFVRRPNRYLAVVTPPEGGRTFRAHVPNPGRMVELLRPGKTIGWIVPAAGEGRATRWDLVAVRHRGTLVSIDSRIANRLVGRTLARHPGASAGLAPWRSEVRVGRHRFDFGRSRREGGPPVALLEVKSSNWRIGRTAFFPDAPTVRGAAHVRALARAAREGADAKVLFVVQRADVQEFAVHRGRDPDLADACADALRAGVHFAARRLRVSPGGVAWGPALPVRWNSVLGTYKRAANPMSVS